MRKLVVTLWQSLDGFISGPNGEMDWVNRNFDLQLGAYEEELVKAADTLVLGRITYESFAGAWPKVPETVGISEEEKAYARRLNSMRKVVFSRTLSYLDWQNSELANDSLGNTIKILKGEPGSDILIYGSASLVRQLTALKLIDEYQLLIFPVALGSGKSLFAGLEQPADFKLCRTHILSSGVAELTYERG